MILILLGTKLVLWPLFDRAVFFCTSCMLLVAKLGRYLQKLTRFASAHISRAWLLRPAAVCIVYKVGQGEVGLVEFKACCASRENNASGRQPVSSHSSNNTSVQIQRLQATTIVLYKYWDLFRADTYELHTLKMLSLLQVVKQYFCSVMWSSIQNTNTNTNTMQIHGW